MSSLNNDHRSAAATSANFITMSSFDFAGRTAIPTILKSEVTNSSMIMKKLLTP